MLLFYGLGEVHTHNHAYHNFMTVLLRPGDEIYKGCWMSRSIDRSVLLVVDALRYDFVDTANVANVDESNDATYLGRLSTIGDEQLAEPSNTLVAAFEADPPTVPRTVYTCLPLVSLVVGV
jgi:predicted AlkP superfamily pyrophosphatase or phosphodiesterase